MWNCASGKKVEIDDLVPTVLRGNADFSDNGFAGLVSKIGNRERRRKLLEEHNVLNIDGSVFPDPVVLIREGREK